MNKLPIILISTMFCFNLYAANGKYGIGASLGSPTGFAGNYILSEKNSIDLGIDFQFGPYYNDKLHIHSTYLWHRPDSLKLLGQVVGWYYGAGGRLRTVSVKKKDEMRLGARALAGLLLKMKQTPIDFFAESALIMNFIPRTSAGLDIAIGARYYF
jgi:hypothetical protein